MRVLACTDSDAEQEGGGLEEGAPHAAEVGRLNARYAGYSRIAQDMTKYHTGNSRRTHI
jgi:hypothetical protein